MPPWQSARAQRVCVPCHLNNEPYALIVPSAPVPQGSDGGCITPTVTEPGLIAYECPDCGYLTSEVQDRLART
jgi:hypothetical protein